ncbi:MAG: hypothetical protein IFJ97_07110 [Acidobacteria bacterium]|uniref:Uncharacterized protein n=1 Tax=Candidatus Sulfomarinibacter kjeldsenii TaxID=2885994 RepID=A0A8J6Y6E4_9BACT|nr:hypothetical protein [Candidatus Sulfomarinibacter kjeldsenii]
MDGIEVGSLVILHCGNPREKMWGLLVRLDGVGVVVRGLDLDSVEDWLRQEKVGGERMIGPTTFFLPMNRVLRIDLDESTTVIDSYGDRYRTACGREVRDALIDDGGIDA